MKIKTILLMVVLLAMALCMSGRTCAAPMGTAFTYQGWLMNTTNNKPADGLHDFQFSLFAEPSDANQIGGSISKDNIDVQDGFFTVSLDFGGDPYIFNGDARWLEVSVRPGASTDPCDFDPLTPRAELAPTPYSLHTRGIFVDDSGNVDVDGSMVVTEWLEVGTGTVRFNQPPNTITFTDQGPYSGTIRTDPCENMPLILNAGIAGNIQLNPTSTGNVGIGITEPTSPLHVVDTDTTWAAHIENTNSLGSGLLVKTAGPGEQSLGVQTGGGEYKFIVKGNGNVGIGTANPGAILHVNNTGTGDGLEITQDGLLAIDKHGLYVYSNAVQTNSPLVHFRQDNASSTQPALYIDNEGSGAGLIVDNGNVGIGTTSPEAKLDVSSTTSGFLPPRMTTAQMNAISSPPEGLMVYDTTTHQWMGYNGTSWVSIGGGASAVRMATGTYTGNGVDNRSITGIGFKPDYVKTWAHGNGGKCMKTDVDTGLWAQHDDCSQTSHYEENIIQALEVDGFQVGNEGSGCNVNGVVYTYICFRK